MSPKLDGLTMWQLWPRAELAAGTESSDGWKQLYVDFDRSGKQPWVMLNMVQSVDGAVAADGMSADGVSASLSSPSDKQIFSLLRSLADFILVGANTVRLENYGPVRLSAALQAQRLSRGQLPLPEIAVVTSSLSLEPTSRLFRDSSAGSANAAGDASENASPKPLIFTVSSSTDEHQKRRAALSGVAEVIAAESSSTKISNSSAGQAPANQASANQAGVNPVDLGAVLSILSKKAPEGRKQCVVLCEGGPKLNAQLAGQGLIDEFCLSLSPKLVGGRSSRLLEGAPGLSAELDLSQLCLLSTVSDGEMLFLRYVLKGD